MRTSGFGLALAALILSAACNNNADTPQLEKFVHGYCFGLEQELDQAAQTYRRLAPAIDGNRLSADQLERANQELELSAIGNTPETRRTRLRDFISRLDFCEGIRAQDPSSASQFATRLEALREGLGQDVMTGAMPNVAKTADLVDQMKGLAHEVNALPFKR